MSMDRMNELMAYSRELKLLYVEDNPDSREMTSLILEDFFDEIVVAVDGQEGLEKFRKGAFDLIITDINMPVMNGLEMIERIRAEDSEIPIIVLSAHNEEEFFIQSITLGVDGYLLKPIDLDQLIGVLERVVGKYQYLQDARKNLNLLTQYQQATNLSSIVSKTDTRGVITFVNDKFCEISGYTKEELLGKPHNIVRHPDMPKEAFADMWHTIRDLKKPWRGIVRNRRKDGRSYYVDSVVMPILDLEGNILEYISLRNDITEIMSPSRQLADAIKNADDPVLVFMKIDNYQMLEEFYDIETIEQIQTRVREYLQTRLRAWYEFDTVYQLGYGEFAFIIDKERYCHRPEFCVTMLKAHIRELKGGLITFDDIVYEVDIVASVAFEGEKRLDSVRLGMKHLEEENLTFVVANHFAAEAQKKAKQNLETVSMIRHAITESKILSYFQPIIDNKTKEVVKYESLVRLIDENGKVLTPYFFLEAAKKSNYYTQITNIVLEHSFSILKNCQKDVSINLSAIDIEQKSTRAKVFELLDIHKEHANQVVFELLEDENVKDFDLVKRFIADIKAYGVKIAIDDFGAGYSNYERLLEYQPDILKIDGSLIRNIETSNYSVSVVKSIVTFAKEQGIQTIAEFIENENIFNIVKELGVDYSQGYYFGKPEPIL
jgi:PAS domain S-box-containing protein